MATKLDSFCSTRWYQRSTSGPVRKLGIIIDCWWLLKSNFDWSNLHPYPFHYSQLLHLNRFLEFSWQGHLLNLLQILKEVSHLPRNEDSSSDHVVALLKFWVPVLASVPSYANLPFTQHGQSLAGLCKYAHPWHLLIFPRTDALAGHILLSCHSQLDRFRSSFRPHLPSLFMLNQGILGCFWNTINF